MSQMKMMKVWQIKILLIFFSKNPDTCETEIMYLKKIRYTFATPICNKQCKMPFDSLLYLDCFIT